jgi:rhodanese-related sulfurtransferase
VRILDDTSSAALAADSFEAGPEPLQIRPHGKRTHWVEADQVARDLEAGDARIIDIDSSLAFRRAHVKGASFIAASALQERIGEFAANTRIVLTSADGVLAGVVAAELAEHGADVAALIGGTNRWIALGLPQGSGDADNLTGDDDAWYSPYHAEASRVAEQMNAYLAWELQLVAQVERDGLASIEIINF